MKKERLQKIKTILYTIIKSRIQVVPTAHAIMCIYKIINLLEIAPLGLDYNST